MALDRYVLLLVTEFALGLVIGLAIWLVVWGFFAAGHLCDLTVLPGDEEEGGPLARLFYLLAIVLFIQLNGHQWLVAFLRESYNVAPVGLSPMGSGPATGWEVLYWPGRMLLIAITAAAPMILAALLASAMVASLERCLGALQIGFPAGAARYLATMVALLVALPLMGGLLLAQVDAAAGDLAKVLALMKP